MANVERDALRGAWAPAGIFAGVGKGSAKRSVGKGVWGSRESGAEPQRSWLGVGGSVMSSPSGVRGEAPTARGFGAL